MSMNLYCEVTYPDGTTAPVPLWQTSTGDSWKIIGCAHDFSNHQGVEPYLTRYLESRLAHLAGSKDTEEVPVYLAHIRDTLDSIAKAIAEKAVVEWYVL